MSKRYYVIGRSSPWVLELEGYATESAASQAISWQVRSGDSQRSDWAICERTGPNTFKTRDVEPETFTVPDRTPYTEKAWNEFLAGWKEQ